ncbi:MAG: hypothetical protein M3P96_04090 [Actinomycetota bacterium]|nr:hypothetical protein [Actinomycetota bacterium]
MSLSPITRAWRDTRSAAAGSCTFGGGGGLAPLVVTYFALRAPTRSWGVIAKVLTGSVGL